VVNYFDGYNSSDKNAKAGKVVSQCIAEIGLVQYFCDGENIAFHGKYLLLPYLNILTQKTGRKQRFSWLEFGLTRVAAILKEIVKEETIIRKGQTILVYMLENG
jgi:uncharacterized protein YdeI (YjbR/CyaY-like superfamily)